MPKLRFKKSVAGWKLKQQSRRKERIKDFLIRLTTAVLFFLLIFLAVTAWISLKKSKWNGRHQLNLIIQSEDVMVFSYKKEEDLLNILSINSKAYIPVVKNFGSYPVGNIYRLGEQEGLDGAELLSQSIQELLAIPIDAYVIDQNKRIEILENENNKLRNK